MTAEDLARLLHGRKVGKGRWAAICPSHPDRTPSLSIAVGHKVPILIKCMSAGCDPEAILAAVGLKWSDLFYDEMPQQVRLQVSLRQMREDLEHELDLVVGMQLWEPARFKYWLAAEKRIREEIALIRCRLEPLKVYREWRGQVWQLMNATKREKYLDEIWRTQIKGD